MCVFGDRSRGREKAGGRNGSLIGGVTISLQVHAHVI